MRKKRQPHILTFHLSTDRYHIISCDCLLQFSQFIAALYERSSLLNCFRSTSFSFFGCSGSCKIRIHSSSPISNEVIEDDKTFLISIEESFVFSFTFFMIYLHNFYLLLISCHEAKGFGIKKIPSRNTAKVPRMI